MRGRVGLPSFLQQVISRDSGRHSFGLLAQVLSFLRRALNRRSGLREPVSFFHGAASFARRRERDLRSRHRCAPGTRGDNYQWTRLGLVPGSILKVGLTRDRSPALTPGRIASERSGRLVALHGKPVRNLIGLAFDSGPLDRLIVVATPERHCEAPKTDDDITFTDTVVAAYANFGRTGGRHNRGQSSEIVPTKPLLPNITCLSQLQ